MKYFQLNPLIGMTFLMAILFFLCSSLRHALFNSSAWDLGIFDQAIFLISQGQVPISSFLGFHIMGDHAAWIFYPLALLYKIYPDVHWLFAVQAIALVIGALPTWSLALQAGLSPSQARLMAGVYLLYPLVFNVNLFDFHPDVLALPALLWAVLCARTRNLLGFIASIGIVLGCKAVLSLTVAALGIWLLGFERKRLYGAIAVVAGIAWFAIATQWILPSFGPGAGAIARQAGKYAYLGSSMPEILSNLFLRPDLILGKVFSGATVEYLILLALPVAWALSPAGLTSLIPAIPALALNILSEVPSQRNLVQQYSIPVLPFLILAVIATFAAQRHWLKQTRLILLWSFISFLALAKYGVLGSTYWEAIDNWQATRQAIALVQSQGSVLTTDKIAPHLTHRAIVQFTDKQNPIQGQGFDYVILNVLHPGWLSDSEFAASLVEQFQNDPDYQPTFARDHVYLFKRG
jgi:uncharacterized membrane protein